MENKGLSEMNSWQHYRTHVNDRAALFSVNLDIFHILPNREFKPDLNKVIELNLFYSSNEDGLPEDMQHSPLMLCILKLIIQISALKDAFYAGHMMSDGIAKLYIYCKKPNDILDIVQQFDEIDALFEQDDPNWDIYFEFLMPSTKEIRFNATDDLLRLIEREGRNLAEVFLIEHTFHFNEKQNMLEFMDKLNETDMVFNTISYSRDRVKLDVNIENDTGVYLVKVQQELALNTNEIFDIVDSLDNLSEECFGYYLGWQCDSAKELVMH